MRVIFIGRLHPIKGIERLFAALARQQEHVTLDIYGSGASAYEATLRRQVDVLQLGARVCFHGHVDDEGKAQAFSKADVMCLPSHSENFGIVVGEALAHGVPVVTTTGTPWEGLETERCGFWVQPDEEALTEALARLEDCDLSAMGARGRKWMRRDFSEDGVVNAMLSLYRERLSIQR